MRGLSKLIAGGALLLSCSVPLRGADADSQTTFSALTSAFGEVAERQAFADGSYIVTFRRQQISGAVSAVFTVDAALDNTDACLCLTTHTTARDKDIPLALAYSDKVAKSVSCYPKGDEANLEAFQEAIKPARREAARQPRPE